MGNGELFLTIELQNVELVKQKITELKSENERLRQALEETANQSEYNAEKCVEYRAEIERLQSLVGELVKHTEALKYIIDNSVNPHLWDEDRFCVPTEQCCFYTISSEHAALIERAKEVTE